MAITLHRGVIKLDSGVWIAQMHPIEPPIKSIKSLRNQYQ